LDILKNGKYILKGKKKPQAEGFMGVEALANG
jgi:hypothetical protein